MTKRLLFLLFAYGLLATGVGVGIGRQIYHTNPAPVSNAEVTLQKLMAQYVPQVGEVASVTADLKVKSSPPAQPPSEGPKPKTVGVGPSVSHPLPIDPALLPK